MKLIRPFFRMVKERLDRVNTIGPEVCLEHSCWISGSELYGKINVAIGCKIYRAEIEGLVSLGRYTTLWGPGIQLSGKINGIEIGAFCSIARHTSMYETYHNSRRTTTYFIEKNFLKETFARDLTLPKKTLDNA